MVRESNIEHYLKIRVEEEGGMCLKLKWIGRRNAPDRIVLLPRKHFLVELKRPYKKATAAQEREHARIRISGLDVFVINSFAGIDEVLQ